MKYLYMNEQERQMQYYKILAGITAKSECKKRIYDRILERCIPVKIDGVSRREAMANDNMQTMKNILKI